MKQLELAPCAALILVLFICSSIIVGTIVLMQFIAFGWRLALNGEFSDLSLAKLAEQYSPDHGWFLKLCLNCFGYLTVFIPAFLIFKYTKRTKYIDKNGMLDDLTIDEFVN